MEIYKLSDNIPVTPLTKHKKYATIKPDAAHPAQPFDVPELRITNIKQAVRNENRVNIYINDKYEFSLDIQQVVDFNIKIGRIITKDELADFKKASEFGKIYQRALEWSLTRPHSVGELRDYLKRRTRTATAKEQQRIWQATKEGKKAPAARAKYNFDDLIVERLCARGYVDDAKFAAYYVENRFLRKGISTKRLKLELAKKGISPELIEATLNDIPRDETAEIQKIIAKKRARYDDNKLIQYLCRQGFPYELSRELVARSSETD